MLFRATVRSAALTLLQAAITTAGAQVTSSKDTPVPSAASPATANSVIVYTDDVKERTGGSPPQFRTTVLTTVEVVTEGKTKDLAEAQIDALCETVENTLLGSASFVALFEGIDTVETRTEYTGVDAKRHTFTATIEIKAHCTEIFEPTLTAPLNGLNIYVDSINVFDPNGSYEPPFNYPVDAPPRAEGPDGRVEIPASLDISQE